MQIAPLNLSDATSKGEASCANVLGGPMVTLKQEILGSKKNRIYLEQNDLQKFFDWAIKNKLIKVNLSETISELKNNPARGRTASNDAGIITDEQLNNLIK